MNKKQIESILKDYHWMMNSIKLLRESMEDAGENITTKYGIESSMPKAQGRNSDPVFQEYKRREKRWAIVEKYEKKVKIIQERIHLIQDERELEVLHWLLEGKSYRWIALHMGLSHSHIKRLRDSIVDQFVKNVPNVTKGTKLKKEKQCV
ncbi:helix-turn-helix transcriptional regulator [Salinibacillus xinjiangensis]|uniref:DNA-binding response regulator n=1 Tax=Salinibacillus xinjiangensis TaxID=1229268 RepID=A0A6G1X7Y8_9BACI|nr:DNA-binding response regulator [Salinibacillus xinjiangensis]MRG86990.1 DNA-binding response regulator [Salinibacillus xinjiangensis]